MSKKRIALLMAVVMVLGVAVGSTMAWLTSGTDPVVNTFTVGDIGIKLQEHTYDAESKMLSSTLTSDTVTDVYYPYVPGDTLPKDPFVTVDAGSEKSVVFVKIIETNNTYTNLTGRIIDWSVRTGNDGWTLYTGNGCADPANTNNGTYYYWRTVDKVGATDTDPMYILTGIDSNATYKNGKVFVNEGITKEMRINDGDGIYEKKPTLAFEAHAVQYDNIAKGSTTVEAAAWNILFGTNP